MAERDRGVAATDPEERAFTGNPDMPPSEPDQAEAGNEELRRPDEQPPGGADDQQDGHGDYGELPGYGG